MLRGQIVYVKVNRIQYFMYNDNWIVYSFKLVSQLMGKTFFYLRPLVNLSTVSSIHIQYNYIEIFWKQKHVCDK